MMLELKRIKEKRKSPRIPYFLAMKRLTLDLPTRVILKLFLGNISNKFQSKCNNDSFFQNSFLFIFHYLIHLWYVSPFFIRIYFSLIYLTHIWLFFSLLRFFFHLLHHIWHAVIIMCIIWFWFNKWYDKILCDEKLGLFIFFLKKKVYLFCLCVYIY